MSNHHIDIPRYRESFNNSGGENTIKRGLPAIADKILKDHNHPADTRRQAIFCKQQAEIIVDKAVSEKRELTDNEQNLFDAVISLTNLRTCVIEQQDEIKAHFDALGKPSAADNRIYAKGEKCAVDYRKESLEGLSLGNVMRGLAIGPNGNHNLQNALSEGTDSAGGYTAPVEILREFIDLMRSKSVLLNAGARTVLLDAKKSNIATIASDPVAGWRAENAAVSESDMVLGNVQFTPKSLAVLIKVSRELLEDSLNIEQILMASLAQGIAQQLDYAGLYGSGAANQPLGLDSQLVTSAKVSSLATNGAKLSASGFYREIVKGMAQVAANNDQATSMILSPRTKYDLGWMADTTNQPLRAPAIVSDNLQLLDTTSIPNNLVVGTSGALCSEVFLGNFKSMLLGMRSALRIELVPQTYAGNLQVGFLAHLRADWQVERISSFYKVKGILAE